MVTLHITKNLLVNSTSHEWWWLHTVTYLVMYHISLWRFMIHFSQNVFIVVWRWNDSDRFTGSPAVGTALEGCGTFKKYSLTGGRGPQVLISLGVCFIAQFHFPFAFCFLTVSTTWPATSCDCRLPSLLHRLHPSLWSFLLSVREHKVPAS